MSQAKDFLFSFPIWLLTRLVSYGTSAGIRRMAAPLRIEKIRRGKSAASASSMDL